MDALYDDDDSKRAHIYCLLVMSGGGDAYIVLSDCLEPSPLPDSHIVMRLNGMHHTIHLFRPTTAARRRTVELPRRA